MEHGQPLVSIVIPCFNREHHLGETLDSVCVQTYPNWECMVVDDHSSDASVRVANRYAERDHRITVLVNQRKKGAQGARNTGILNTSGEYIIFLDSDDLLHPDCLRRRVNVATEKPGFGFYCFLTGVFCQHVNDSRFLWNCLNKKDPDICRFLKQDMPWHTCGVLWNREAVQKTGLFDERLTCWQDWEYHVRALALNIKYFKVADRAQWVDSYYRQNPLHAQISKKNKTKSYQLGAAMAIRYGLLCLVENQAGKKQEWLPDALSLIYRQSVRLSQVGENGLAYFNQGISDLGINPSFKAFLLFYFFCRNIIQVPALAVNLLLYFLPSAYRKINKKESTHLKVVLPENSSHRIASSC